MPSRSSDACYAAATSENSSPLSRIELRWESCTTGVAESERLSW
jgi:hypothetical protein